MNTPMNRRQWLRRAGTTTAAGILLGPAPLSETFAQTSVTTPVTTPSADRIIRLHSNENPYGPSPRARAAMTAAFDEGCRYPDEAGSALKQRLAEREGVTTRHIIIATGSSEVLTAAGLAYGLDGGELIAARPTYKRMLSYAEEIGGTIQWVPLDDHMVHDLNAMDQRISQATRVVYVCNPNNPTGTLLPPDALRDFCISASKKVPVFVDEAYYEVVDPEHRTSMVDLVKAGHNVIVARTFSKVYGLAGLRIGYGIASPDVISQLERYKMSFQNVIGLRAALASLDDPEFETFSRVKIDEARRFTYALLDELGLRYTPSHGNFVLFHTGQDIQSFQTDMRWRNIGVGRPFPPYLDWCRLSMSKMEDMTAFADALRDWAQARS